MSSWLKMVKSSSLPGGMRWIDGLGADGGDGDEVEEFDAEDAFHGHVDGDVDLVVDGGQADGALLLHHADDDEALAADAEHVAQGCALATEIACGVVAEDDDTPLAAYVVAVEESALGGSVVADLGVIRVGADDCGADVGGVELDDGRYEQFG